MKLLIFLKTLKKLNQNGHLPYQKFGCYNWGEYMPNELKNWYRSKDTILDYTIPFISQQMKKLNI